MEASHHNAEESLKIKAANFQRFLHQTMKASM
jgi:hypothetical protein